MDNINNITAKKLAALMKASTESIYGLPIINVGGILYAVAKNEAAANAAHREYIKATVWDLNEDWLMEVTGLETLEGYENLDDPSAALCELIEKKYGLERFIDEVVESGAERRDISPYEGELKLKGGYIAYPMPPEGGDKGLDGVLAEAGIDFDKVVADLAKGEVELLASAMDEAMMDIGYNVGDAIVKMIDKELTPWQKDALDEKLQSVLGAWLHKWISENF